MAIIARDSTTKIRDFTFPNPDNFEVLTVCATVATIKRKFYLTAAYIPPNYTTARGKACLEHINNLVLNIKRNTQDPYILIAGDFNQWDVGLAVQDYADLVEVPTPATRGERHIDRIFTNWSDDIHDSGCLPPLETEGPADTKSYSDHKIQYMCSRLVRKQPVVWETFVHRPYNEKGADAFIEELSTVDWTPVYSALGKLLNYGTVSVGRFSRKSLEFDIHGVKSPHLLIKKMRKKIKEARKRKSFLQNRYQGEFEDDTFNDEEKKR